MGRKGRLNTSCLNIFDEVNPPVLTHNHGNVPPQGNEGIMNVAQRHSTHDNKTVIK